jgi:hypothetical protein
VDWTNVDQASCGDGKFWTVGTASTDSICVACSADKQALLNWLATGSVSFAFCLDADITFSESLLALASHKQLYIDGGGHSINFDGTISLADATSGVSFRSVTNWADIDGTCAQTTAVTCTDATTAGCESDGYGGFTDACTALTNSAACLTVDQDSDVAQDCTFTAPASETCVGSAGAVHSEVRGPHPLRVSSAIKFGQAGLEAVGSGGSACLAEDAVAAVGSVTDTGYSLAIRMSGGELDCARAEAPCTMLDRIQVMGTSTTVYLHNLRFYDLSAQVRTPSIR